MLAYINKGAGDFSFEQKVIYAAPHPNWGSSGIQLVDLDKDGDLDVLLTHGDTFDDGIVKPYHGIQWLENTGDLSRSWSTRSRRCRECIAREAADLDGDGDLDIVACALLGERVRRGRKHPAGARLARADQARSVRAAHDRDGHLRVTRRWMSAISTATDDLDIVVGNFSIEKPMTSWVDVWSQVPRPSSRVP